MFCCCLIIQVLFVCACCKMKRMWCWLEINETLVLTLCLAAWWWEPVFHCAASVNSRAGPTTETTRVNVVWNISSCWRLAAASRQHWTSVISPGDFGAFLSVLHINACLHHYNKYTKLYLWVFLMGKIISRVVMCEKRNSNILADFFRYTVA